MTAEQAAARALLINNARLMYVETLEWVDGGQIVTARCRVTAVSDLSNRDRQAFLSTPGFNVGEARLSVHPDDELPPVGATCEHPRFGTLLLLAYGPERYYTGSRTGALTWTQ